jgi:hypothetical protein
MSSFMFKYGGFALKLCCYDLCILSQYSKPQVAEDQEGCQRRHRRPTGDDGAHEIDSGNVVSVDMLPLHAKTNNVATHQDTCRRGS